MDHVTLKHKRTTLERAEKFISVHHFTDINLRSKLYPKKSPLVLISHYKAPGRITVDQALKGDFVPVKVGQSFGPTWSTHWFCLDIEVPPEWNGEEVHLLWNSNSEAEVWVDGKPIQGLSGNHSRISYALTNGPVKGKFRYKIHIEMACNDLFGAGDNGMINEPEQKRHYALSQAEIAVFNRHVYNLILDVEMLHDMAKHLSEETERGYQALYTVNHMINILDLENLDTYHKAHEIARSFFNQKNGESCHTLHAMGHAHIDTAWLWPYAETIRKCARSWSCTLRLMEQYPNFTFTCSQAQQFEWVKSHYPSLYKQLHHFHKKGQFVPVGGTWVEMDGNLPSGESFVRQFLYGQRFFKKEFGQTCQEFWLPDTFGYSAQLPQIMRICHVTRFLTQKLSWSLVNKFPHHTFWWEGMDDSRVLTHFPPGDSYKMKGVLKEHHTFWWEGVDGSRVLTHFPPGDSYEMKGNVKEVLYSVSNYKDKGRSGSSVYLFGYGDGGNGPSEEMLQRIDRMKDTDGLPRVKMSTPDKYFSQVERDDADKLCCWKGELYLELHNGTYTTQAMVKKMNRKCEFLLRDVEFVSCMAMLRDSSFVYPSDELLRVWKLLLLNQFHDVLPGSSIALVYQDSDEHYKDIEKTAGQLLKGAVSALLNESNNQSENCYVFNTLGWERTEIVSLKSQDSGHQSKKAKTDNIQIDSHGDQLAMVTVPSFGYSSLKVQDCVHPVTVTEKGEMYCLKNQYITAEVDQLGRVVRLNLTGQDRNAVDSEFPANQFVIFDDVPLYWDAWDVMDYHLETRKPIQTVIKNCVVTENGPLRVSLQFSLKISEKSNLTQTLSLDAASPYLKCDTQVTWHENRKFLKVEFPTSIKARCASYDIQFGHLQRPNLFNTSWDWAQFEVCGHKWADISEFGFGLAVLNDSKYGYSCKDNILRLSLLRSPKAPDADADMGHHQFTYAIMPHTDTFQQAGVIQQAYNLNCPLYLQNIKAPKTAVKEKSFFYLNTNQVVLETVKKHEDSGNLVIRLYEAFGGQTAVTLTTDVMFTQVCRCTGLEEPEKDGGQTSLDVSGQQITFTVKPFQIVSLLLTLG